MLDKASERIPLAVPEVRLGNERRYLNECIDENFVSTVGRFVGAFEGSVRDAVGARHAVSTASGTAALHLGLVSLGVKPGDLVIAPTFTFIATANAIAQCGADPWLFDIDPGSWTINVDQVLDALEKETDALDGRRIHRETGRPVTAMLPVHTLGTAADLAPLYELARDYGLKLLADGACALGVRYRNQPITRYADLTAISFNGNKTVTSGGGGMIVGDDEALMARVRHLCTTARTTPDYDHDEVGFNYRMTNIEAAVGLAQMEQLDGFLSRKRQIRQAYDEAFKDIAGVRPFPWPTDGDSAFWFSGVVLDDDAAIGPQELIDALARQNIEARKFWKPVHLQRPYKDAPRARLDTAEALWSRIVTLPCSTSLSHEQQARVIHAVRNAFARA